VAVLAALLVALTGCASVRTNQFRAFSSAGVEYAKASRVLYREAGIAAIDADSAVLERTRETASATERQQDLLERNKLLRERLALLNDLSRHAELLQSYFEVLAEMADSRAPAELRGAAEGIFRSLEQVSGRIRTAKVGSDPVSRFAGSIMEIGVARHRNRALDEELNSRKKAIEREIDLQEAALRAVREQMQTDLEAQLRMRESGEVVLPYVGTGSLPKTWHRNRREVLMAGDAIASLEAAQGAAARLKRAFAALVEGRLEPEQISGFLKNVNEVLDLVQRVNP
jgi:hypothetical protein